FVENAELSLSKADLRIGLRYLSLAGDDTVAAAIEKEFRLTTEMVLAVTEHERLLDCRPQLQTAVELRNPYVDALSFLQLRFLEGARPRNERTVVGAEPRGEDHCCEARDVDLLGGPGVERRRIRHLRGIDAALGRELPEDSPQRRVALVAPRHALGEIRREPNA